MLTSPGKSISCTRSSATGQWCSAFPARPTLPPDSGVVIRLRQAGRLALDLVLPPRCAACDNPVGAQGQLCAACFGRTNFISAPFCPRCGVPFASVEQGGVEAVCPGCQEHPHIFRQARAALRYDEHGRRMILPLKHGDRVELASILAPMMVRAGAALLERADVLVPVPLHRRRLFQRKYNQAAVLRSRSATSLVGPYCRMAWRGSGAPHRWTKSRRKRGRAKLVARFGSNRRGWDGSPVERCC